MPGAGEEAGITKSWDVDFKKGVLSSWCWYLWSLEEEPKGVDKAGGRMDSLFASHQQWFFTLVAISGFLPLPEQGSPCLLLAVPRRQWAEENVVFGTSA